MNKKTALILIFTMVAMLAMTVVAFAADQDANGIGIQTTWFFNQLSLILLVVAGGLTVMFFIQKQTVKAITTIVIGSVLYVIVHDPAATFSALGGAIKGLFGIA